VKNKGIETNRVEDCLALADSIALRFLNIPGYSPAELRQDARVFLHDAWDAFEGAGQKKTAFPAWAKLSIRNRFIDIWRKEMRRAGKIESLNIPDADGVELGDRIPDTRAGADVPDSVRHAESTRVFHEALAKITGDERRVLLAVMDDKSYSDIGRESGISKEAVRKRFWKAAAHLREVLGEQGFFGVTQSGVLTSKRKTPNQPPNQTPDYPPDQPPNHPSN
jgi:RNA polymerase sigma factor (sigma-70 family)